MATQSGSLSRLIWRDASQITALLIATLVGGIAITSIILAFADGHDQRSLLRMVAITLPYLFVFGAPAMLIGQEFEQGTLAWTRTLPISWKQVFASKWLIAIVGLLALWGLAGLIFYWSKDGSQFLVQQGRGLGLEYILPATLAMTIGFAVSWKLCHPFPSLLVTVIVYSAAISILENVLLGSSNRSGTDLELNIRVLIAIGVAFGVSMWFAHQTWTAPWSYRPWWQKWRNQQTTSDASQSTPSISRWHKKTITRPVASPFMALVWQHAIQARLVLILGLCVGISAILCSAFLARTADATNWQSYADYLIPLTTLLAVAAPALLGAATYNDDNHQQRYRFLSEHGISPARIWLTRQIIPVIAVIVLLAAIWPLIAIYYPPDPRLMQFELFRNLAIPILLCFFISHWAALLFQRTIIVLLASILLFGMTYVSIALLYDTYLDTHSMYAWAIAGLVLLWLGTALMVRPWADGDRSPKYYARGISLIAAALIIPQLGFYATLWLSTPGAEHTWHSIVATEAQRLPPPNGQYFFVTPTLNKETHLFPSGKTDAKTLEQQLKSFNDYQTFIPSFIGPVGQLEISPALTDVPRDDPRTYSLRLDYILKLMQALRDSRDLFQLPVADQLERSLAEELLTPESQSLLSKDEWQSYINQLGSRQDRQLTRNQALIRFFVTLHDEDKHMSLGHNSVIGLFHNLEIRFQRLPDFEIWRTKRFLDRAGRLSWESLQQLPQSPDPQLHAAWQDALLGTDPPSATASSFVEPTITWTEDLEQLIERANPRPITHPTKIYSEIHQSV